MHNAILKTGYWYFFVSSIFIFGCSTLSQKTTDDRCTHTSTDFRCVQYIDNYDGDTITFDIHDTHPLIGQKISVRVKGVDTPEIRTKNSCEKKTAQKAKAVTKSLLSSAKRIDLKNIERGKYFRIVADVQADSTDLKTVLFKEGLAYPYDGRGPRPKRNWCQ